MEIKGLRKAVREYKQYNAGGAYSPEYGELMYDKSTGELWTDYFYSIGHNNWKKYDSADIVNLGCIMEQNDMPVTMENVKRIIEAIFA